MRQRLTFIENLLSDTKDIISEVELLQATYDREEWNPVHNSGDPGRQRCKTAHIKKKIV